MSVLYAEVPYRPTPAPGARWAGTKHIWTGWDGTKWELSNPDGGVFLTASGVRGLAMPPLERFTSQSSGVAGSRWRGQRALERTVFWPLAVFSDAGSAGWLELDRAFWRTMHPGRPGVWAVEQPGGETRSLTVRFADDGDHAFTSDPVMRGWEVYGVRLVAEDPFWRGPTVERTWKAVAPVDFFGAGGGPPFYISSASQMASARVANPGDEEAFPVWVEYGPAESLQVGVGDRVVDVPFPVAAGRMLVVDTRPTAQTAKEIPAVPMVDGRAPTAAEVESWIARNVDVAVNRTRELGASTRFAAVPPGESVDLSLSMLGEGVVQMILTPLFHRAL